MWKVIVFSDGSNPYICKTEDEFRRMASKYNLRQIGSNTYQA